MGKETWQNWLVIGAALFVLYWVASDHSGERCKATHTYDDCYFPPG